MIYSTRSFSPFSLVVILLGIILISFPLGTRSFAQPEEDHHAFLQALDSLSSERMLADVTTLSSPFIQWPPNRNRGRCKFSEVGR